jgi:ABC-type dipeptide/oligopeptide/nickel transport system ATPase component
MTLLQVKDLTVSFGDRNVLQGIDFTIGKNEAVGLIGESASGKSTLAKAILGFCKGTVSGTIHTSCKMGMIFQDPLSALNPTMKIRSQILEGHQGNKVEALLRASQLMQLVGLEKETFLRYPHQLSGGQRQRALLLVALMCEPQLLVADEPTTALDNITKAQTLSLLQTIRRTLHTSLLLISHDVATVSALCEKVLILHEGKIVESGLTKEIFASPRHPYTKLLLNACPWRRA